VTQLQDKHETRVISVTRKINSNGPIRLYTSTQVHNSKQILDKSYDTYLEKNLIKRKIVCGVIQSTSPILKYILTH